jgi:tRNA G10  N-methylase Trm11
MREYVFVLGRDFELSILEIISYLKMKGYKWELKKFNKEIAIFSIMDFDVGDAIKRLGGCVKIGLIVGREFDKVDVYSGNKNKISYGISVYGKKKLLREFEDYLKKWFKVNRIRAKRRKRDVLQLSPRDLKNSIEFMIIDDLIAKTIAISNPSEYKRRDRERPFNEYLRSISIRLARILINLSQVKEKEMLLDPFCGVGIILEEALFMGINVIGVDVDSGVCKGARRNLEYFKEVYGLKGKYVVYNYDSGRINNLLKRKRVDGVATEPYLGPYFKRYPGEKEIIKTLEELESLYYRFFNALAKVLRKGGKVAFVLPVFKSGKRKFRIKIDRIVDKTSFRVVQLHERIRFPVVYSKRGFINREIYVFEKI